MDDEPQVEQLENRIDRLESKIEKMMPSRRDALKMGGAALIGGAAMSGTASAGTNQVGTIGDKDASPPQLVDLHSEDINNADTVTTDSLNAQDINAVSVNTENQTVTQSFTGIGLQTSSDGANPTYPLRYGGFGNAKPQIGVTAQNVPGDNTFQDLITGTSNRTNGLLVVAGSEDGGQNKHFVDLVIISGAVTQKVIATKDRGAVGTRNYDTDVTQPQIQIDEPGQAYDVTCWFIGSDRF